jgi:hypothetical protein
MFSYVTASVPRIPSAEISNWCEDSSRNAFGGLSGASGLALFDNGECRHALRQGQPAAEGLRDFGHHWLALRPGAV